MLPTQLLHSAILATQDAVVCASPDGLVVLFNPAAEGLFGRSAAEVLGKPLDALLPAIDGPDAAIASMHRSGAMHEQPVRCLRGDGSWVYADVRRVATETPEGTFFTLVMRVHADERRAIAELSLLKGMALSIGASEDLVTALELVLRQIGEFTGWTAGESWLPNVGGHVLRRGPVWSDAAGGLTEFHRASEVIAFRRSEGLPGRAWDSGSAVWVEDVTADRKFVRANVARRCGLRTGFAIPVLAGASVVAVIVFYHTRARAEDAGLVDLVAAVATQLGAVIQRKQSEDELLRHSRELARSNAELEQFAYVASHDLQEPLRMVASYTQLLERRYADRLDDDAREFIGFAVEGVTRMRQLILDLLALSRVNTRNESFEPTELGEVLQRAIAGLGPRELVESAELTWNPLPRLRVDAAQVGKVFENLIANALKFRGEEPPRIHISASRHGHEWVFACRDNGIGIEPEFFDRIFVIFQRLHSRAEYPGTGIGLAICKKIIERHGGRIWVESLPGQGSTFFFTIPEDAGHPAPPPSRAG